MNCSTFDSTMLSGWLAVGLILTVVLVVLFTIELVKGIHWLFTTSQSEKKEFFFGRVLPTLEALLFLLVGSFLIVGGVYLLGKLMCWLPTFIK